MSRTMSLCIATIVAVLFATAIAKADESTPDPFGADPAAEVPQDDPFAGPADDPFAGPADTDPAAPSCCQSSSEQHHEKRRYFVKPWGGTSKRSCCAPIMLMKMSRSERRIHKTLLKPTELDFIETPLRDVVAYLREYHGIEIQIDAKALDDVGLVPDEPVTKQLRGISLRSALRLILRDLDLTYIIQDEVLMITTPEEAECRMITMLYPVDELLPENDEPGMFPTNAKTLIPLITASVRPTSWEEFGGPGSIRGVSFHGGVDILVISQAMDVHNEIAELLEALCRVAKVLDREQ